MRRVVCNVIIRSGGIRHSSGYKYYQILNEPQPDDITTVAGGIPIIKPPKPKLTGVVETRNPDEWKFVESLLPSQIVPEPPRHEVYPTPSGWVPPKAMSPGATYHVERTRFHNFPIYLKIFNGGNRAFTEIRKIQGNIWDMDADVKRYLTSINGKKTYTKVDEVCCKIWVRGRYMEDMSQFLIDKGF